MVAFLGECGTAGGALGPLEEAVCTATGPTGLGIIAVYSFLIAFILPLPSEVVLVPAETLRLGLSTTGNLAAIILASAFGKAVGSLFAFHIGQEAKEYGPLVQRIKDSRFDLIEWSEKKTIKIAQEYGYVGLALALCVPFFPDTLSIYAFTVLEEDYLRFGAATFVGSAGRLLVTLGLAGGTLALL
ncbi:YqaA family protein [Haloarcula nitratireducens]|uniref:VTT domain-containing protein n=1 Tax=Haloarcula nitratireducens TaxID=2487749 RepID=A0AAW4P6Z2_9EURY|nr:VTT domain-containing protein [Halomicroarcula nitratireducens]MBX0293398.1 VTT domain-containing protein [Halomicroarcula nitratireducens]